MFIKSSAHIANNILIFIRSLTPAMFVFVATLSTAKSAPLDFTFSFAGGGFTVTGIILGLEDDTLGQPAESVVVLTNSTGLGGLGDYVTDPDAMVFDNTFNVSDGEILFANFISGIVPDSFLAVRTFGMDASNLQGFNFAVVGDVEFSSGVSPVPLPAGGLLLACGLIGLGALRLRSRDSVVS